MGYVLDNYRNIKTKDRRIFFIILLFLCVVFLISLAVGEYSLSLFDILKKDEQAMLILKLRLPRAVSAVFAGASLSLSGYLAQNLLKNPLASPFTLGISNAAAFGAAAYIIFSGVFSAGVLGSAPLWGLPVAAFGAAAFAALCVVGLSRIKSYNPSSIILAGVALSSLFLSGTVVVQFFADDAELAGIVFWAFGDVARPAWGGIWIMGGATLVTLAYTLYISWSLSAFEAGDETAGSLGVSVQAMRTVGVLISAMAAASIVAFCGVIAFVGLIAPHIAVRLTSSTGAYRALTGAALGALLMVTADLLARNSFDVGAVPVGVFTSFLGAPMLP